jgi:hypothetical protein
MKTRGLLSGLLILLLLLTTCGPQPSPSPTTEVPAGSPAPAVAASAGPAAPTVEASAGPPAPTSVEPSSAGQAGLPLPTERGTLFSASGLCTACHMQMVDQTGVDVSTDIFWRASMMANSGRDPYWQASVRGEVLSNPDYRAVIEDKCATCHLPMARFTTAATGGQGQMLDDGFLAVEHPYHALALDGVSCTLCHQIREDGFSQRSSYSGGFVIDTALPSGRREVFGPYQVPPGLARSMQASSGFGPLQGPHMEQSELCATCHTLYTPYLDAAGQIAGEFPEQMPYLEWLASGYADSISCQDCHMPLAQGGVQLSITGGPRRTPFYQHVFVGGNAYMLEVLESFGQDLAVTASAEHFQDKRARTVEQLQQRTAAIVIEEAGLDGTTLTADLVVANRTGHKLPTGFPARRLWIHVTVQDANGQLLFESGAVNPDGFIAGNDNDTDPGAYEPHYLIVEDPSQVQIYEAIMGDTEGAVTTILLKGAGYLKDNRLLPMGFDKSAAQADIAVYGAAAKDRDFAGSSDRVRYVVDLDSGLGPFTISAELLYQSIGYRWADNLRRYDAPEPIRFVGYYEQVSNHPVVVASTTREFGE